MPSVPFRRARGTRVLSARAARAAALALAAAVAVGACDGDDDPTGVDEEPQIQSVRLTVTPPGSSTAGAPLAVTTTSNTPIQLRVGTSTVTAVALDANGQPITFDEPFQFRMVANVTAGEASAQTPLSGVLTFTPGPNGTGALSGTITASAAAAATTAWVRMVHVNEAHSDFDARVQVSVVP
jgi:hypothetical protein